MKRADKAFIPWLSGPTRRWLGVRFTALAGIFLAGSCGPLPEQLEDVDLVPQAALTSTLGASYDGTRSNITFNVYSSAATRIRSATAIASVRSTSGRSTRNSSPP